MKKVVKINESDLERIVNKVITESIKSDVQSIISQPTDNDPCSKKNEPYVKQIGNSVVGIISAMELIAQFLIDYNADIVANPKLSKGIKELNDSINLSRDTYFPPLVDALKNLKQIQ